MAHYFTRCAALVLLLATGCAHNSERAAKMARSGPKNMHASDEQFFAMCKDGDGRHASIWVGPVRTSREWAIRDAGEHEKKYPGHHASIEH